MDEDETAAFRWLLGRGTCTETVRTEDGRRIEQYIGEGNGKAALVRLLRLSSPLHPDIRNVIANALSPGNSSEMRLELVLVRRVGRGRPRKDAAGALDQIRRENKINVEQESGAKPYIAVEDAANKAGLARSTMFKARKIARRAKAARDGEI